MPPENNSASSVQLPERLGRYQIVRELGMGAMGIVYEGRDPNIGRRVAIKTARRDFLESSGRADEMMERFLREARAAGALNHPNIVTIYDADQEGDMAYIAMEFLEGTDLQKLVGKKARMTPEQVVELGATLVLALAHAHDHGIVHRDVKPANIILLPNGAPKIADFGIAHVSGSDLTQEGAFIGTPFYMSPEQFMGHPVDGRADLFAAGVILYELLTGERPFAGEAVSTVMHNVLRTEPVPPRELNFAVNENLNAVIMKALSKDPNKRYQTGVALANALRESLKASPDPAILKLAGEAGSVEAAATMVGGGGPPSARTVATPSRADAKTVAMAETRPMAPEAVQVPSEVIPAAPEAPPIKRPSRLVKVAVPALAAVGVVAAIAAGIAVMTSGSGVDESGPYWGSVTFDLLWLNPETLRKEPVEATITILDGEGKEVATYQKAGVGAEVIFPTDKKLKVFKYKVEGEQFMDPPWEGTCGTEEHPTELAQRYPVRVNVLFTERKPVSEN